MAHECARHGVPCYHFTGCYAELKDRLRAGDLTIEELAFVGFGPARPPSRAGWHEPTNLSAYELDAPMLSAEDSAMLAALMDRPELV